MPDRAEMSRQMEPRVSKDVAVAVIVVRWIGQMLRNVDGLRNWGVVNGRIAAKAAPDMSSIRTAEQRVLLAETVRCLLAKISCVPEWRLRLSGIGGKARDG